MDGHHDGTLFGHIQDVEARRRAAFWAAMRFLNPDVYQCRLLERLWDRADAAGRVEIDLETMAADRAWLCCGKTKAREVVKWALQLGCVTRERAAVDEAGEARSIVTYSLRWDRVEEFARANAQPRGDSENRVAVSNIARRFSISRGDIQNRHATENGESPRWEPAGKPHARASGSTDERIPTATEGSALFPVAEASEQAIVAAAIEEVCPRLWKGRRESTYGVQAANDQRLAYQLARLLCDPRSRPWVDRLLDAARHEGKKPAAFVCRFLEDFCPGGWRLVRSIHVPAWAHADPREWPQRLQQHQQEGKPC